MIWMRKTRKNLGQPIRWSVHRNCCGIPVCGSFSRIEAARRASSMPKLKRDPVREDRIHDEAIVDAYGPEEQALGWYYYLENKIRFPFQARCIRAKAVSPRLKRDPVKVRHSYCPVWYCHAIREGGLAEELAVIVLVSMFVDTAVEGNHGGAKLLRAWNRRSK